MKTIYKCEICGKEFSDWEECGKHEKTCKEIHATGLRLASERTTRFTALSEPNTAQKSASSCSTLTRTTTSAAREEGQVMTTTNGIYAAINGIMEEIGAIGKTSKNQQQGFMYRGIDAVMNALQPALVKHKVFVVPEILEQKREERVTGKGGNLIYSVLKIKYTFYAEDGSSVSATVIGEGMDSGDKASNKAMSVAFKYACFQVLCIPTEEMKDPDAETPPESLPKPTQAQLEELQKLNIDLNNVATYFKVRVEFLSAQQVQSAIDMKRKRLAAQEANAAESGEEPPAAAPQKTGKPKTKYQQIKELGAERGFDMEDVTALALDMFGTDKINSLSDKDFKALLDRINTNMEGAD